MVSAMAAVVMTVGEYFMVDGYDDDALNECGNDDYK
jgi:hypothetical protein